MKAVVLSTLLFATFFAQQASSAPNPVKGEELFKQCSSCHAIGEGASHTVGPTLNHVFGRIAGKADGYTIYSDAMRAKGEDEQLLWDEKSLYIFLAGPARYIPGTIMGFEGLRKEQEIKDLLAYLISFSPAYEPESSSVVSAEAIATVSLPVLKEEEEEETPTFDEEYLANAEAITIGGELWAKQCRHCHGNSAYPGKAPKLTPARYKPEFVFNRVTDGFRKMPAWKSVFTLEERKAIVAYVQSNQFSP